MVSVVLDIAKHAFLVWKLRKSNDVVACMPLRNDVLNETDINMGKKAAVSCTEVSRLTTKIDILSVVGMGSLANCLMRMNEYVHEKSLHRNASFFSWFVKNDWFCF